MREFGWTKRPRLSKFSSLTNLRYGRGGTGPSCRKCSTPARPLSTRCRSGPPHYIKALFWPERALAAYTRPLQYLSMPLGEDSVVVNSPIRSGVSSGTFYITTR